MATPSPTETPSLRDEILAELRRGRLGAAYRRDLRDIYRFYLGEDERERLAAMGHFKRFFWITWWLARNLLRRLSPSRRLLLLLAAVLFVFRIDVNRAGGRVDVDTSRLAVLPILWVLMLELKDKLLARDEIEVARQVQLSLQPKSHPSLDGWEIWSATTPANDVGGDLVDYLDGSEGRLGLALGDVAGKGMGAALLCAKLQATLRALAPSAADAASLGAALNGVLERAGLENRYATLFYAEIEGGDGTLRYLNAGHNPALLLRAGRIEPLPASSLPLGMLPDVRYSQGLVALAPGDALVVYSDGLTEATRPDGEEYGLDRLRSVVERAAPLPAEPLARRVLEEVDRFLDHEKPHDDQSILVVRRRAP